MENLEPFPRVARFTARSYDLYCLPGYDVRLFLPFIFHWELGVSRYKPSEITFSRFAPCYMEEDKMARADKKTTKSENSDWKGFINVELTEADKAAVTANWEKAKYATLLQALVDVGKLSISYNEKNNSYNAAVVFYDEPLKGFCVSSFAKSPLMAVYITWYKLDVYADSISPDNLNSNRPDFG